MYHGNNDLVLRAVRPRNVTGTSPLRYNMVSALVLFFFGPGFTNREIMNEYCDV